MENESTAVAPVEEQPEVKLQGFSLDPVTVTQKTADYPPEHRALVLWFYDYCRDRNWSKEEMSAEVGVDWTTIYRVWNGKYRHPKTGELMNLTKLCHTISTFRKLMESRASLGRLPFIETSVFRRIRSICTEALQAQCCAFIFGESQIGKTHALKEVVRRMEYGRAKYILTPAHGGLSTFVNSIAFAYRMSTRVSTLVLLERLTRCVGPTDLLIFDEIHEAFQSHTAKSALKIFGAVRQFQQVTKCGIVFCGTNVWRDQLEEGDYAKSLKQLRKRAIWELQLEDEPTREDLTCFADHYQLPKPSKDTWPTIEAVNREHGLGKFTLLLARSHKVASDKKERFSWDHFVQVVAAMELLKKRQKKH